jgi:hypothetical protein
VKVVFLDFDGVLNSLAYLQVAPRQLGDLDPVAVARLDRLVARSGAKVVVSSTWRLRYSLAELRGKLAENGFTGEVLDCTPELPAGAVPAWCLFPRCDEIRAWLAMLPQAPARFVILDDADLELEELAELSASFVRTDVAVGLLDEDVERALRILEG